MGIEADLKYPMNEEGWIKTIAIGSVLEYLSFLFFPFWILLGYYVRVMRHRMRGIEEPPGFDEYGELLKDGLKFKIIIVVYNIIPIAFFVMFVLGGILALLSGDVGAGLASVLSGLFVTAVLFVLFSYVGVAGVIRFAETDSMGAAFSPSILAMVFSGSWLVAWLKVLAYAFVVGLVGSLISTITAGIGALLVPVKIKYLNTVVFKTLTDAYVSARDVNVHGVEDRDTAPVETSMD